MLDGYAKHIDNEPLRNMTYYEREIILKEYLLGFKGTLRYDATVRPVREMETTTDVSMIYELYGMLYNVYIYNVVIIILCEYIISIFIYV